MGIPAIRLILHFYAMISPNLRRRFSETEHENVRENEKNKENQRESDV
jgi:hypothetical protein